MKILILLLIFIQFCIIPVGAAEIEAPVVPEAGELYMPKDTESFSEGLWYILKIAAERFTPSLSEAAGICLSLFCIVLLISVLRDFSKTSRNTVELAGTLCVGVLLMGASNSLIHMAVDTVTELSQYATLLLPAMTAALAAQGAPSSSAALYTGSMLFCSILTTLITKILVPLIYIYICLAIAYSAIAEDSLKEIKKFITWLATWSMKICLYIFTGYMTITKIVAGTVDANTLRVAKLTISGMVPVVGKIISDASDTILVGAGIVKNGVGIYGLLAILSVLIGPFIKIGAQYLLFKLTASICSIFGVKSVSGLIADFSKCLAITLAMVGILGLMLMISTVCFMKGIQ